ncbi:ABC transporter substrate-binding protein [Microbispora bryophytorum]|uniref:ABC transporter substrate-binding protein n=1 Tax=Microbispora bryophytorum TaxID=1460882 RepID=UPI001431B8A8|nr:ABC transporter substrate-binding protein [Microbispora bryophytorum]MBD3140109.1 ABC transporter substrate-binding protein [Microbispora bryophytorum]
MISTSTSGDRGPSARPAGRAHVRRPLFLTAVAAVGVLLAACGTSAASSKDGSGAQGVSTVRVGVIAGSPPGVYSAIENGFFDRERIKVELVTLSGGPALVAATEGGSIDIAWADIFAWAAAIEQGFKLTIINPANALKPGQQVNVIVTKPGSGITSAKDLTGKKLGVPAQALTTVQIKKWLADQGLDPDGPTYTTVQDRTTSGGLAAQGTLDAAATSGAYVTAWEAQYGLTVAGTFDSGVPKGAATSGYGALRSYAEAHPDLIKRFVRAVRQGVTAFQSSAPLAQNTLLVKYGGADVSKLEAKYPGALDKASAATSGELSGPFDVAAENTWIETGARFGALKKAFDLTPHLWPTATSANP